MFCKNCGQELDEDTNLCSYCGVAQNNDGAKTENNFIKALGTIGALAATNKIIGDYNKRELDKTKKLADKTSSGIDEAAKTLMIFIIIVKFI